MMMNIENPVYKFVKTNQGTRMDGEPLYGLTVTCVNWFEVGLPVFLKDTQYDDLTEYEVNKIMSLT